MAERKRAVRTSKYIYIIENQEDEKDVKLFNFMSQIRVFLNSPTMLDIKTDRTEFISQENKKYIIYRVTREKVNNLLYLPSLPEPVNLPDNGYIADDEKPDNIA